MPAHDSNVDTELTELNNEECEAFLGNLLGQLRTYRSMFSRVFAKTKIKKIQELIEEIKKTQDEIKKTQDEIKATQTKNSNTPEILASTKIHLKNAITILGENRWSFDSKKRTATLNHLFLKSDIFDNVHINDINQNADNIKITPASSEYAHYRSVLRTLRDKLHEIKNNLNLFTAFTKKKEIEAVIERIDMKLMDMSPSTTPNHDWSNEIIDFYDNIVKKAVNMPRFFSTETTKSWKKLQKIESLIKAKLVKQEPYLQVNQRATSSDKNEVGINENRKTSVSFSSSSSRIPSSASGESTTSKLEFEQEQNSIPAPAPASVPAPIEPVFVEIDPILTLKRAYKPDEFGLSRLREVVGFSLILDEMDPDNEDDKRAYNKFRELILSLFTAIKDGLKVGNQPRRGSILTLNLTSKSELENNILGIVSDIHAASYSQGSKSSTLVYLYKQYFDEYSKNYDILNLNLNLKLNTIKQLLKSTTNRIPEVQKLKCNDFFAFKKLSVEWLFSQGKEEDFIEKKLLDNLKNNKVAITQVDVGNLFSGSHQCEKQSSKLGSSDEILMTLKDLGNSMLTRELGSDMIVIISKEPTVYNTTENKNDYLEKLLKEHLKFQLFRLNALNYLILLENQCLDYFVTSLISKKTQEVSNIISLVEETLSEGINSIVNKQVTLTDEEEDEKCVRVLSGRFARISSKPVIEQNWSFFWQRKQNEIRNILTSAPSISCNR